MVDTLLGDEVFNGGIGEFRTIVTSDSPYWEFDENFNSFDKVDEIGGCF